MAGEISWDVHQYWPWVSGMSDGLGGISYAKNVRYGIKEFRRTRAAADIAKFNDISFASLHANGAYFTLADASVRFLAEDTELHVLQCMASRSHGEVVDVP